MKCKKCGGEISPFVVMNRDRESVSLYLDWIENGKTKELCIPCYAEEKISKQEPIKYRV